MSINAMGDCPRAPSSVMTVVPDRGRLELAESFAQTMTVVGRQVHGYEIGRRVDQGGMAGVYEAQHATRGDRVAFKVLRPEMADDPVLVRRFFNEARAAQAIGHPNVIRMLDLGVMPNGLPYLMMELLEGETLAHRISRGPLEIRAAVAIALQTAAALGAAHARGIVHRDVKPGNLFLSPHPRRVGLDVVKLLDFGIAKLRGEPQGEFSPLTADLAFDPVETLVGSHLGTPAYMPPEQWRGRPARLDQRADVYALGVVLYEMVCGKPPFQGGFGDLMLKHMSADPPPPSSHRPDVPPTLARAILRALAKDPADRFTDMAEFAAALAAEGDVVKPPAPAPTVRRGGAPARSPAAAVAALAMLAILVGATVVGLRRPAHAPAPGFALRAAAVSLPAPH